VNLRQKDETPRTLKSSGTLAQTALPQVLLEEECKWDWKKLEWHEGATSNRGQPIGNLPGARGQCVANHGLGVAGTPCGYCVMRMACLRSSAVICFQTRSVF
jgi:hypothetical protein